MKVVTNASPLHYAILIEAADCLPALFDKICVAQAVIDELSHPEAPPIVQAWIAHKPNWLEVHSVASSRDAALLRLHLGERETIILTERLAADLVILDEKAARQLAKCRKLKLTGLLGILDLAAERGLISLSEALQRLDETNFRIAPQLLNMLRAKHS